MTTTADIQPLADPAIRWVPAALTERGVVVLAFNLASYTLHFGDGTSVPGGAAALRHTYAKSGAYKITARDSAGTELASVQAYVRDGLAPAVTFATAADNQQIIEATLNADPADLISRYEITWGVDGPVETVVAAKGTVRSHGFAPGTHTVTVRDLHTGRVLRHEVTVVAPTYDPDFSLAKGADVNTALLTLTAPATAGKAILVAWGDGQESTIAAEDAKEGAKLSHPYARSDVYIVQVVYTDSSTDGKADSVSIPFPARDGRGIGRP